MSAVQSKIWTAIVKAGVFTAKSISAASGAPVSEVRKYMNQLRAAGMLVLVRHIVNHDSHNRMYSYRVPEQFHGKQPNF